jgi:hypothetical protein
MMLWALFLLQQPTILELPVTDANPYISAADAASGRKLYSAR